MGKIFYILGKSSTGKDTIYKRILNDKSLGLESVVLYTTRPIRDGEIPDVTYHFVDEDTFMLTDYGAAHLYGIIPLFYSERSIQEMFMMSDKWLNDKKGEDIYLENYDRKAYDAPSVAVDLIVFNKDRTKILLIDRADHPYVNKMALPGGFYQPTDKTLEFAAVRELMGETSVFVEITEKDLVKVTSTKDRDPRGWVISVAYAISLEESLVHPVANSDAIYARWVELDSLRKEKMAFDHYDIIQYALAARKA